MICLDSFNRLLWLVKTYTRCQQKAAAHAQPATYEPRAPLSRQLSGASAVTASTTASSGHPGHASGYDTSTTHR